MRSRSSPPNHYYSYIDYSINNDNDVGATSATPLATELIAPPPPRPQIKKPASLPEFSYMNQQSVSSDNFNNWRPELLNHEDTQTPNTIYHPQHPNNQDPVSNSVRNMEMDPSYSYGYSMHDKVNNQEITDVEISDTNTLQSYQCFRALLNKWMARAGHPVDTPGRCQTEVAPCLCLEIGCLRLRRLEDINPRKTITTLETKLTLIVFIIHNIQSPVKIMKGITIKGSIPLVMD